MKIMAKKMERKGNMKRKKRRLSRLWEGQRYCKRGGAKREKVGRKKRIKRIYEKIEL